jgi:cbb3-type cytochrome oxidase subunit 3
VGAESVRRLRPVTIALLAARLLILLVVLHAGSASEPSDDVSRFQQIVEERGVPYRDFPVEYAPLEVVFVREVLSADAVATTSRLALVAFAADLATWLAVGLGWGTQTAERYLWLGTPLLVFLYVRFDLVPAAVATSAVVLAIRGSQRVGGATFAAAILTKLWPAALLPGLLVAGYRRAFAWALVCASSLVAAWLAIGGVGGVTDVLTFRHATGWEVESTVGTFVWIGTGGPVRMEAGAQRIGTTTAASSAALVLVLTGLLIAVWVTALKRKRGEFGAASVAALGALLACSATFSLQYVAWLLPWAAVAWFEGDRWTFRVVAAIEVLTAILAVVFDPQSAVPAQVLLVCRNLLVVTLPVMWLVNADHASPVSSDDRSSDAPMTGNRQTNR